MTDEGRVAELEAEVAALSMHGIAYSLGHGR
jgi:hypothetical protein